MRRFIPLAMVLLVACSPARTDPTIRPTVSVSTSIVSHVTTAPSTSASTTAPSIATAPATEAVFETGRADAITLLTGGDTDVEVVGGMESDGRGWRSGSGVALPSSDGNTVEDWYIQFDVDDGLIYQGNPTTAVVIAIEYLDVGTDGFSIQYDGVASAGFAETDPTIKADTGGFVTAVYVLDDAWFGNRTNGGDFRITDHGDGPETIRRIVVTPDVGQVAATTTTVPGSGDPPGIIFHNGPILTMADPPVTGALAVRGEAIVATGTAADVLALAGPDTQVVDLAGRTLMPGFVDPHTHILNNAGHYGLDALGGQQLALENGITTLANMYTNPEFLAEMQGYGDAGVLRVRTSLYLVATDNCGTPLGDWWTAHPPTRVPGEMLRIGGIKLFLDGGTCGPMAITQGGTDLGAVFLTADQVATMVNHAAGLGHQVVIHAMGDAAILTALDAYADTTDPDNPLRHRIEHLVIVTDEVIERFGEAGVIGAVFGQFLGSCTLVDTTPFFEANYSRHQDLMEANPDTVLVWHGDDPWVGPISPLQELHALVTRVEIAADGSECAPLPYMADRRFDVETGLRMMTIDAAYAIHRETEVGSLEVGKYADLIVLSADPTAVAPRQIHDVEVLMTMVGGRVEVCANADVCPAG